jgi:RHS repeat-associated protein
MAVDDKYVMNGVWLTCDKGVTPSRFNVTPKPVQLYDEHFANELDKIALVNILPFGACSVKYGSPCLPVPVLWERVMEDGLTVLGARPLLDTSKCQCAIGGQIAIHFTKAGASAAVALDQNLDKVDEVADLAEKASGWAFWGGIGLAVGGAILCATGVGAPLGAAMIVGGGELIEASTILASAAAVVKGVTKFARDPSKEAGLSIVGEVATNLALNFIMNKLGGVVVKQLGKWAQKAMNKLGLSERASKLANRLLCTVTGHPVDVISGYLYTETVDFEFAATLPLRWERLWNSTSVHAGPIGHGWHHSYDLALVVEELEGYAALRAADGRGIAFDVPDLGDKAFNRLEKLSLLRDARGYGVLDHGQGLTYRFGPANADGVRALAAVENANGFAITFTYDAQGHMVQIVDSAQRQFAVQCDEAGRILTISTAHPTEPRQRVTLVTYSYNSWGELVSAADALEQAATYHYQDKLLVQETFKNGLSFYFEYVGQGPEARCTRTWGDEGIYDHKLVYDLEAKRTVVTNSLGHATTYLGNENGLVVAVQDARGGVTRTEYNEHNEVLRETDALGQATSYKYDKRGNCVVTATPDGVQFKREYDDSGRLVALTDAVGGRWQWAYDKAGNLIERTNPAGNTEQYSYENGLLKHAIDITHRINKFSYNTFGNLVEVLTADGQRSRWLYDMWGQVRKSQDVRSNVQWREYDLLGRVTAVHEPDGNVRRFTYDELGNATRIRDQYSDVQYVYWGMSRLIRRVEADTTVEFLHDTEEQLRAIVNEHGLTYRFELDGEGDTVVEVGFDGLTRRYTRDVGGRITELLLPDNERTSYSYDAVGRVTQIAYSDGNRNNYCYRSDGSLLQASNNEMTVEFTRDGEGRVLQEVQGDYKASSTYDRSGQRITLTSSLGTAIQFKRNVNGIVEQIVAGTWQVLFERDAQGLEIQRTLGRSTQARWKRDTLGRPLEQSISAGFSQSKRIRRYDWQPGDRLAELHDNVYGITRFEHDTAGNLVATTFGDGTRELRLPDAVGNLFTSTSQQDRRYGPAGQLLEASGTRYEYDSIGNLNRKITAQGEEWHYVWNSAGHLVEVMRPDGKVVQFAYDALGRRVSKSYAGQVTRWVWDGDTILHEWQESRNLVDNANNIITWIFEEESFAPIAKLQDAQGYDVICDYLGTPLQMYNQRGELAWAGELNSYGCVREQKGGTLACPFRYQGQYEDQETGLYYNRFRYYMPENGTYISQDPLKWEGSGRLYSYVRDPTTWVDVLGLIPVYRNLRPDENPANGLSARKPGRGMTPAGHVRNGSNKTFKGSQYISTTTDPAVVAKWRAEGQQTVKFDTDDVIPDSHGNRSIVDISTPEKAQAKGIKGPARNYAVNSREVLVEGHVPGNKITNVNGCK